MMYVDKVKNMFKKDPKSVNLRSELRKILNDEESKKFLQEKYKGKTTSDNFSELLYLYFYDMEKAPNDGVFMTFDKGYKIYSNKNMETKQNVINSKENISQKNKETLLTFAEDLFKKDLINIEDKRVYFISTTHVSGDLMCVFYIPETKLVYICLIPKSTKLFLLKQFLERDFNIELILNTMPLDIVNKALSKHIQDSNVIAKFGYVMSKKHTLY